MSLKSSFVSLWKLFLIEFSCISFDLNVITVKWIAAVINSLIGLIKSFMNTIFINNTLLDRGTKVVRKTVLFFETFFIISHKNPEIIT